MNPSQICPVPYNQRPLNEYKNLKEAFNFKWIFDESSTFFKHIIKLLLVNYLLSYGVLISTYIQSNNPLETFAKISIWPLLILTIYLLRRYLACNYILNRLMSSSITYEESGWYDGQTWIKSKEMLLQDRLIGTYELLPKVKKIKISLIIFTLILGTNSYIIYAST